MSEPEINLESLIVEGLERLAQGGEPALEKLCAEHPQHAVELRARVDAARQMGLVDTLPASEALSPRSADAPPDRVGPYRLVRTVGSGGMGEVWLGEQEQPVKRRVAVKLIRTELATERFLDRFQAERQALALMEHDGIARIYDTGTTPDGAPYLIMEYVDGGPVTDYCDGRRLGVRARVELCARIADAIEHAHQNGVIHRDLKPTNLLVTESDGRPVPKVIDFGLAKAIDIPLSDRTQLTQTGQIVGTPEYMSPEQAWGGQVDTRTDVYSLGVVLYELLTGQHPLRLERLGQANLVKLLHAIGEQDAVRPSSRVSKSSVNIENTSRSRRQRSPRALAATLRGDLDCILLRALSREPAHRYASIGEFASDLRRYLQHEPVLAGSPGRWRSTVKFMRRHPTGTAAAALLTVSTLAFLLQWKASNDAQAAVLYSFDELGDAQVLRTLRRDAENLVMPVQAGQLHDMDALDSAIARAGTLLSTVPKKRVLLTTLEHRIANSPSSISRRRDESTLR